MSDFALSFIPSEEEEKPKRAPNTNPGVSPEAPPDMIFNPQTGQYTSRELLANSKVQNKAPGTGALGATIVGAGRGATLGGIDELSGYLNAIIPGQGTMAERNTFGRENVRATEQAAAQTNPDDLFTSEIAGALSLPFAAPFQAMGLLPRVGGSAAAGATIGGVYGGLTGEGQDNRLDQARTGATIGGIVGGAAPLVGAGIQKIGDTRATNRAVREAVANAPTTDQLRAAGRAGYQAIDDAGVAVRPDVVQGKTAEIARLLADEGADPILTPNATRVATRFSETGQGANTVPFSELDKLRRVAGNAAGANPANKADTRLSSMAIEELDDFIANLGPGDVDAGDLNALQEALPKARELWARMSRSGLVDDAIEAGTNNYRSGAASGIRAQFQRIVNNPKLRRGFSDAEVQAMRRVVNGTLPEQLINYLGSGLGMVAQTMAGGAAGTIGGLPGMVAGAGAGAAMGAGTRKLSENIVRRNAEIARALVASGKGIQLPQASTTARDITEALMRRAGPVTAQ